MKANKEFWAFKMIFARTDKERFEGGLAVWYGKWEDFLTREE